MLAALSEVLLRAGSLAEVYVTLGEWGVSGRYADAIVKYFGARTIERLTEDPYKHLLDVPMYGWKTAENIAQHLGIVPGDPRRITAGIAFGVHNATWAEGHTWLSPHGAAVAGMRLLGCSLEEVTPHVEDAIETGRIVRRDQQLYPTSLDRAEELIASEIFSRIGRPGLVNLQRTAGMFEGTTLNYKQLNAVLQGLTCPISLLTGGPGTGKTTCLKTLIEVAQRLGLQVTCMAPTGKAAARMAEATGYPATTIHSRLHLVPGEMSGEPLSEPLSGIVVVDEVSMLDTQLAAAMLRRISLGAQLLLVGDPDQLPSVGPGAILRDLILAGVLRRTHLDQVFRNDKGIAVNAKNIRDGNTIANLHDCQLISLPTPQSGAEYLIDQLEAFEQVGIPRSDVLVLTPTNGGPTGRIALNAALQSTVNAHEAGRGITQYVGTSADPDGTLRKRTEEIRTGDPVMVTRNNKELGVFNGQVGVVTGLQPPRAIVVSIDGDEVIFAGDDKHSLTLAYALTGHKAQGSEAPFVLCPVFPSLVLCREWVYTTLTRAKECVIFIGDLDALQGALRVERASERRTGLVARLTLSAVYADEGALR